MGTIIGAHKKEIRRNRFNNFSDHDSDSVNEAIQFSLILKRKKLKLQKLV